MLVVSYNLENYHLVAGARPKKSESSHETISRILSEAHPDILALQEMGNMESLTALQTDLRSRGCDLPHHAWMTGWDTNIHLAVLSRYPITSIVRHERPQYLLHGRRLFVSRGFLEAEIQVSSRYQFTLINAHLKSKRPVAFADQGDMREEEARLLRELIEKRLKANPGMNLLVAGDFNDTQDSPALKRILGSRNLKLLDTRPVERPGPRGIAGHLPPKERQISWTHYYSVQDSYTRIDYILASPGMQREWRVEWTRILTSPDWGLASDHRPILAGFIAEDQ